VKCELESLDLIFGGIWQKFYKPTIEIAKNLLMNKLAGYRPHLTKNSFINLASLKLNLCIEFFFFCH
jgi:hypothetical protein